MNSKLIFFNASGWMFGTIIMAIGLVNTFWGNDPFFGIFILFISLIYFPPVNELFKKVTRFSIPLAVKIILGLLVLWAALGVGELHDKIDLMMMDL